MTVDTDSLPAVEYDTEGRAIPVTEAEKQLLAGVKTGEVVEISTGRDVKTATAWDNPQTIRATFLRHLCLQPDLYAIDPRGIRFMGALVEGEFNLHAATLKRHMWVAASHFTAAPNFIDATTCTLSLERCYMPGFTAHRITVSGDMVLHGSIIEGLASLMSADIKGNLNCSNITVYHPNQGALFADNLKTGDNVFLNGSTVSGGTRLLGANIKGCLECNNANFAYPSGVAFFADSLKTGNGALMKGNNFIGEVRLLGAHIKGNLEFNGSTFCHSKQTALNADRLKTGGYVFLRSVTVIGETQLLGADIGGNLECDGASFEDFLGQRLCVRGNLIWRKLKTPPKGLLDLTQAQVVDFMDDGTGWPEDGKLMVDDFHYENLSLRSSACERKTWLALLPKTVFTTESAELKFWPQPYEQLIKVFREAGHERDAREMAIAKQDAYADYLERKAQVKNKDADGKEEISYVPNEGRFLSRLWLWFIKWTAGYGYAPWRAGGWGAAFMVLGWLVFAGAYNAGFMVPSKERIITDPCYIQTETVCAGWKKYDLHASTVRVLVMPADYTEFNPLTYAIDTFIPIVDLHQETYWSVTSATWLSDGLVRLYLWLHIIAGWVLTSIAVAGFTGLIKKD